MRPTTATHHRTDRRMLLGTTLGVAGASALAGGLPLSRRAARAQDATEITYFTFSAAPDHLEDLDAMIVAFQEANPGVTVKVETAPYADYFTELQTRIAGGDAPDVFELNYENFVTYASRDVLLDVTDRAASDPEFAARYYPKAYEAFALDGKQYGLPASFSNVVLFYNKDVFDAAGVAYPTADWNWEDERAAATQLNDPDNGVWGQFSPVTYNEFYKTAAQNGGTVLSEDGSVTIDSPACAEALDYMVSAVTDGVQPSEADMAGVSDGDMFASGELAMITTGIWMFSAFAEAPFAWDIALEPGNTQKAHHFFANATVIAADTDQADAAWAWAQFLTSSADVAAIRVASSWELPALSDDSLVAGYLEQTPPDSREVVFEALESLVTPPVVTEQAQMQDAVDQLIQQVLAGDLTSEEALAKAKTEVEGFL
jgi:multiple sugar transport system substrate-binding protein